MYHCVIRVAERLHQCTDSVLLLNFWLFIKLLSVEDGRLWSPGWSPTLPNHYSNPNCPQTKLYPTLITNPIPTLLIGLKITFVLETRDHLHFHIRISQDTLALNFTYYTRNPPTLTLITTLILTPIPTLELPFKSTGSKMTTCTFIWIPQDPLTLSFWDSSTWGSHQN